VLSSFGRNIQIQPRKKQKIIYISHIPFRRFMQPNVGVPLRLGAQSVFSPFRHIESFGVAQLWIAFLINLAFWTSPFVSIVSSSSISWSIPCFPQNKELHASPHTPHPFLWVGPDYARRMWERHAWQLANALTHATFQQCEMVPETRIQGI
jgi:hypothetical protein